MKPDCLKGKLNMKPNDILERVAEKVRSKKEIEKAEALELMDLPNDKNILEKLFEISARFHKEQNSQRVSLCSIISGKQGNCSEDCSFCAQSAHYETDSKAHSLLDYSDIVKVARETENSSVNRFSIVTSGKRLDESDFSEVLEYYEKLKLDTDLHLCASHGTLKYEELFKLKEAGVKMYHHNLETGKDHYSKICTTHSYEERVETIKAAKRAGLKVCSGGIFGMGETNKDRVDMLYELKDLQIESVPINILMPIPKTPLENMSSISSLEVLKIISVYRLVLPKAEIRYGAGRALLGNEQRRGLSVGINGMITGNYLTTTGSDVKSDKEMILTEKLSIY